MLQESPNSDGGGEAAQELGGPALEPAEAEESITPRFETSPHVDGEEEEGDELSAHGPDCGSAHAKRRQTELAENQEVVQNEMGDRHDDRCGDQSACSSQAQQQCTVGETRPGETDTVGLD